MVSMPVIGRELCLLRFEMVNKWIDLENNSTGRNSQFVIVFTPAVKKTPSNDILLLVSCYQQIFIFGNFSHNVLD